MEYTVISENGEFHNAVKHKDGYFISVRYKREGTVLKNASPVNYMTVIIDHIEYDKSNGIIYGTSNSYKSMFVGCEIQVRLDGSFNGTNIYFSPDINDYFREDELEFVEK